MNSSYNILIAGVGGQGNLMCGRILGAAAMRMNLNPVIGDTFGASRRGGTVYTHLRIGEHPVGPLIPGREASLVLGLEPMETLRAAVKYAGERTVILFSTQSVETGDSLAGNLTYPSISELTKALGSISEAVYALDPKKKLDELGTRHVLNSYMLGALTGLDRTPLERNEVRELVGTMTKPSDTNLAAFDGGLEDVLELLKSKKD